MERIKIAIVGAGSMSFSVDVINEIVRVHKIQDCHVALMDPSEHSLTVVAALGKRIAADQNVQATFTTHTDFESALDGAQFVVFSAERNAFRHKSREASVVKQMIPEHYVMEFGGVVGISHSLRQIALAQELSGAFIKCCPDAWLLNVANPLPRVCQAFHELGIKTAGFCSASTEALRWIYQILHGRDTVYPFKEASDTWHVVTAGVNHFVWLCSLVEKSSGNDMLPEALNRIRDGVSFGNPICENLAKTLGVLPMPNDHHVQDFISQKKEYHERIGTKVSPEQKESFLSHFERVAQGETPLAELRYVQSWEKPVDFIAAFTTDYIAKFRALNVINGGQIPGLPLHAFVETPCVVESQHVSPQKVALAPVALDLCSRAAAHTDAIVKGALSHSLEVIAAAVELDPTIVDKQRGIEALKRCIAENEDIAHLYSL